MSEFWAKVPSIEAALAFENHLEVKDTHILRTLPLDKGSRLAFYYEQIREISKDMLHELLQDFFDTYAVSLKDNKVEVPSFVQIDFGNEYNDDGGGSNFIIEDIHFFDQNEQQVKLNFEIEYNGAFEEYTFREALREEITERLDANQLYECFSWNDLIPIFQKE